MTKRLLGSSIIFFFFKSFSVSAGRAVSLPGRGVSVGCVDPCAQGALGCQAASRAASTLVPAGWAYMCAGVLCRSKG